MLRLIRLSAALLVVFSSVLGGQTARDGAPPPSGSPSSRPALVTGNGAPSDARLHDGSPAARAAEGTRVTTSADARVPSSEAARVGVRASPTSEPPPPPRADTPRNRALMVVGGVALLVGLIIGDDAGTLIAVGGAVAGLYGLFRFLE